VLTFFEKVVTLIKEKITGIEVLTFHMVIEKYGVERLRA